MKYDNTFDNKARDFFTEYKKLCNKYGLAFVSGEKSAETMCFNGINGPFAFVRDDDFATFEEFCEDVEKYFFDKCD